ncbi:MAG: PAS domain S-box protein, partial [Gemmatimonadota bacterium]
RQRVEQALRESEAHYRLLYEVSHDAIMTLEPPSWRFTAGNPATVSMFRAASEAQFVSCQPWRLSPERQPDGRLSEEKALAMIEAAMGEGYHFFDWTHRRLDGEDFPATVLLTRVEHGGRRFLQATVRDITERRRAEEELRRSESNLRKAQQVANVGSWMWHTKTNRLEWSDQMYRIFGLDRDSFSGELPEVIARAIHPDDRAAVERSNASVVRERRPVPLEYRVIRPDGTVRVVWAEAGELLLDGAGNPEALTGIVQDITERQRAEEELRQSQERLLHITDAVPVLIGHVTDEITYDFLNGAYERWFGAPREALLGRRVEDVLDPAAYARSLPHIQAALRGEEARFDGVATLPDGSVKHFENHLLPDVLADGQVAGYYVVVTDVTDRQQTAMALRESEERFRSLYETTPVSLWEEDFSQVKRHLDGLREAGVVDLAAHLERDGECARRCASMVQVLDVNEETLRMYGAGDKGELLRNLDRVFVAESLQGFRQQLLAVWDGRTQAECETVNQTLGGRRLAIFLRWQVVPGHDQDYARTVVSIVDLTERQRAQEEKARLEAQLHQAQKMESVGRLAGGVAHDFNNMLGVILGQVEMSLLLVDPTQPLHASLQEIHKAARRSADLTRQLLAFARRQTVTPQVLDLNQTVSGMHQMLQRLIGEDVELAWLPGADLWPVKVDPSQVDQILANLCVNARDAIADVGRIAIETGNRTIDMEQCGRLPGSEPGEYVLLAVSDDGCGMDAATQAKIFDPYFTTKEVGKGSGLGLATVYGAVTQNGGFIHVASEPGKGTTFEIYLPRHVGKAEQRQREGQREPLRRGHETVLLVEDEPALLEITTEILQKRGYTVLAAGTPVEALRLAREHRGEIHLLMTDVVMPEMNGRDLARALLSLYPDAKRVFMSGYTADVIAHQGVLEEGVQFVQKPFSIGDLVRKVREALDRE